MKVLVLVFALFGASLAPFESLDSKAADSTQVPCSCELLVKTVGAGVDVICEGMCHEAGYTCDYFTEWTPTGGIITTCACIATEDDAYSCGDKDCEAGYEWAPGPGGAFVPVGAKCWTVECAAAPGCKVIPPPYAVHMNPCNC